MSKPPGSALVWVCCHSFPGRKTTCGGRSMRVCLKWVPSVSFLCTSKGAGALHVGSYWIFTNTSEHRNAMVTSIIRMQTLRLRELGSFVQGSYKYKTQNQDSKPRWHWLQSPKIFTIILKNMDHQVHGSFFAEFLSVWIVFKLHVDMHVEVVY